MATPSLKEEIQDGLVSRLETIKASGGYDTDVIKVFSDKIPMAIQLDEYELPAILVVGGDDKPVHSHGCIAGVWEMELQLIHNLVDDDVMHRFVRDVNKAIYADSPVATRVDAWRAIHPNLYDVNLVAIDSDLNMIEANRFFIVHFLLHYRSKPYAL